MIPKRIPRLTVGSVALLAVLAGAVACGSSGGSASSSGSSGNTVSVFARADGSVTTTITDAKGNVVSSNTTTRAKPAGSPGSVLDVKA